MVSSLAFPFSTVTAFFLGALVGASASFHTVTVDVSHVRFQEDGVDYTFPHLSC